MDTKNKLFSLIIPCHNPEKTIFKLFDSLTRQNIPKDDLEIIVVDDNSSSLEYWNQLKRIYTWDMRFVRTDTDIHCPGNTRLEGMKYVTGEWLFFCDQDDFFEDGALAKVKDYIRTHTDHKMYVISTIMRACDPVNYECHTELAHKQAWLHGKWYSMENLIIPYNINFKENLVTHEDVYFNSCVLNVLFMLETDWDYFDIYTYRWVDNPESLTRQPRNDRGYLFENFGDYITSASEPYWKNAKELGEPVFMNQLIMTLLHCYFYYEAVSYYEGPTNYRDIIIMIKNYIHDLQNDLNYSPKFIVDFVYADHRKYEKVRQDCMLTSGGFIPKTSFRDFVFKLAGVEV